MYRAFKKMYSILKLNSVALKSLMFSLLVFFYILETCSNNFMNVLSVLVTWQRNGKVDFCETGFLYIFFSTITNRIHRCIAYENDNVIDVIVVYISSKFCQTLFFSFTVAMSRGKRDNLLLVDTINKRL